LQDTPVGCDITSDADSWQTWFYHVLATRVENEDPISVTECMATEAIYFASLACNACAVLLKRRRSDQLEFAKVHPEMRGRRAHKSRSTPTQSVGASSRRAQ
jgi:hypothetical protein